MPSYDNPKTSHLRSFRESYDDLPGRIRTELIRRNEANRIKKEQERMKKNLKRRGILLGALGLFTALVGSCSPGHRNLNHQTTLPTPNPTETTNYPSGSLGQPPDTNIPGGNLFPYSGTPSTDRPGGGINNRR